jgi:glucose-6-phosphate 1-epimerase
MHLFESCSLSSRGNIQTLQINNRFAQAEIALFGAHILSFIPKHDGRERLWLSEAAIFDGKQAIRGGIPVCWPWFGDHPQKAQGQNFPAHGYVRTQQWQIIKCADNADGTQVVLQPTTTEGAGFAGQTSLSLTVDIGSSMSIKLTTSNIGQHACSLSAALHSYFSVSAISQCSLHGLSRDYLDKTRAMQTYACPSPYVFAQETDRVHLCQPQQVSIHDSRGNTDIAHAGHDSIVVWNPWSAKSISMQDMADDGFQTMLCVETALTQAYTLQAQASHTLQQVIY